MTANAERGSAMETPLAWRVAAAGALVGGASIGFVAGTHAGRLIPMLSAGVTLGCALPIALASRRAPISPETAAAALERAARRPTFTVVVAARDEAGVIGQIVEDVAAQDYREPDGSPCFELLVVDDRSIDGTGSVAREAARASGIDRVTRVVRREGRGLPDGKGAALTAAPPEICHGDIVLVLDADARIGSQFLRRAAGYFAAGARAVTARRRILDPSSSQLAGAQADEQTLDGELQRGRWALGGCSEFRGDGIMVSRELLADAGGWRASALTEDVDLSSRIGAVAGERVAWAIDAEVWEEPVRDLMGLWRQRRRWAEGGLRRVFEHGPAVLRSPKLGLGAKLDFATYTGQLVMPIVVWGAAASALVRRRPRPMLAILAGYVGLSGILSWDSLRWERHRDGSPLGAGERLRRATRISIFNGFWLFVVPRVLWDLMTRGGPIEYVKMEHAGSAFDRGRAG